jgi:hypothetical protein
MPKLPWTEQLFELGAPYIRSKREEAWWEFWTDAPWSVPFVERNKKLCTSDVIRERGDAMFRAHAALLPGIAASLIKPVIGSRHVQSDHVQQVQASELGRLRRPHRTSAWTCSSCRSLPM